MAQKRNETNVLGGAVDRYEEVSRGDKMIKIDWRGQFTPQVGSVFMITEISGGDGRWTWGIKEVKGELAMKPQQFQKKPVVIDALQWDGTNARLDDIRRFMGPNYPARGTESHPDCLVIHTLEGDHRADIGDWIIRGVKGEFYPYKPDIFEQTYEAIQE